MKYYSISIAALIKCWDLQKDSNLIAQMLLFLMFLVYDLEETASSPCNNQTLEVLFSYDLSVHYSVLLQLQEPKPMSSWLHLYLCVGSVLFYLRSYQLHGFYQIKHTLAEA